MTWKSALATAVAMNVLLAAVSVRAEDLKPATPPTNAVGGDTGATSAAGAGWSTEVAPSGTNGLTLDARQIEIVKQISDYFNSVANLKGAFVQTAGDNKRMKGKFYVKRPGRFRFDYSLPSKQIIISDGEYLAIQDLDLNNEDRVALDQTPFRLVLRKDVDLGRDARIMEVQESADLIIIAIQDKSPDAPGSIRLFFSTQPTLELKEWVTTDAQGGNTRVEVSQLDKSNEIDAGLFKIHPVGLMKQP
jgi:outer membrane lipoprotein-sorting protein